MKTERADNLEVNFLNVDALENLTSVDRSKLWAVRSEVVVEKWTSEDGKNWYRKWSDGWIEQGGLFPYGSGTGQKIVTLNTPFTQRNYTPSFSWNQNGNSYALTLSSADLETFIAYAAYDAAFFWKMEGY
jgi:hypothetical protein